MSPPHPGWTTQRSPHAVQLVRGDPGERTPPLTKDQPMWLMTTLGFYSLVEKKPGVFHVRSRERVDLENLVAQVPLQAEIIETPDNDYACRVIVDQEAVSRIMAFLATHIDYDNFKNRIHDTPDQAHKPYSKVWSVIEDAARKRAYR